MQRGAGQAVTGLLPVGPFLGGALLSAVTLAGAGGTAWLIVRRRRPDLSGSSRAAALGLLTIAGVLVAEIVPLALGVLTRLTPAIAAVLLLGLTALALPPAPLESRRRTRPRGLAAGDPTGPDAGLSGRVSLGLAGIGLLATATAWIAYMELVAGVHLESIDAMNFHLPGVVRFIQTGSLWTTTQYLPGQAQGNYPQNGDMLLLALVLPWHSLAFVRYVDLPLLALAGLAVYATGRELRAPATSSALVALAVIAIRPTLGPALQDSLTDPCFLAGFACGMLFVIRHRRTGARGDLALAGLGLGIALGTKWYGLTDVPAVIVCWGLLSLLDRSARPLVLRGAAILIGCTLLGGGIWLVRNWVLTGNPVFDYKLSLFGVTIFPAPPDPLRRAIGFDLAHYATSFGVLRHYVWPVFRQDFGLTGLLIVLGALAGVAWRQTRGPRVALLALAALLCAIAYSLTPYSAQGYRGAPVLVAANTRYGAPALILAAPVLALLVGRLRRLRPVLELVLLGSLLYDLHRYLPSGAGRLVATGAVLLAGGAVAVALAHPRFSLGPLLARRTAVGVAAALAALAFAYHYERRLGSAPYSPSDPTVDYVLAAAPAHARIGITGEWTAQGLVPVAALFGPRLQNRVSYVGPFRSHRLEQYGSEHSFVAALQRDRYPLLEIGTGFPPSPDPAQARWALAAGYRPIVRSPRLILMRRAAHR